MFEHRNPQVSSFDYLMRIGVPTSSLEVSMFVVAITLVSPHKTLIFVVAIDLASLHGTLMSVAATALVYPHETSMSATATTLVAPYETPMLVAPTPCTSWQHVVLTVTVSEN